jgi:predicted transcriptional regulator
MLPAMFRERFRLRRDRHPARLDDVIGPLERRVLDWLWARSASASVRDLQPDFPTTAYTTLMTTLDRLHRKGLLERIKAGRAFQYRPRFSREELASEIARQSIERLLGAGAGGWRPVLSALVETVSQRDKTVLDELERLIREHRKGERGEEDLS